MYFSLCNIHVETLNHYIFSDPLFLAQPTNGAKNVLKGKAPDVLPCSVRFWLIRFQYEDESDTVVKDSGRNHISPSVCLLA